MFTIAASNLIKSMVAAPLTSNVSDVTVPMNYAKILSLYQEYNDKIIHKEAECLSYIHPHAVSPNKLTPRFQMTCGPKGFMFYQLPIHEHFLKAMIPLLKSQGKYFYEGPQGIGKSFTLLYVVILLRTEGKERYRTIYVNNPEAWKVAQKEYIINEMIWAFMADRFNFPPCETEGEAPQDHLEQWYNKLQKSKDQEADFRDFLSAASKYCEKQHLKLVAFMDQENFVSDMIQEGSNPISNYKFPYSYYQNMPHVFFIFTLSSANNQTQEKKRTAEWIDFSKHFQVSVEAFGFPHKTREEIIQTHLSALKLYNSSISPEIISQFLKEIMRLAGNNPYELMLVLTTCIQNPDNSEKAEVLQKNLREYMQRRFAEILKFHMKFVSSHISEANLQNYAQTITYIDLEVPLPSHLQNFYDKKIAYLEGDKLKSLFPLAKAVLYSVLANQQTAVEKLVSDYICLGIGGHGYLLEFYIIFSMKQMYFNHCLLKFQYRDIRSKITGTKTFFIEAYEDMMEIPLEKPKKTTLYVPLSKSYPDIDCLIYDLPEDKLYPIQITLTQKNHKDSYHSWTSQAEKKWLQVFKNSQVSFIWLVGHPKKYTRKNQNYWVVIFDSLPQANPQHFRYFEQLKTQLKTRLAYIDENAVEVDENGPGAVEDNSDKFKS